MGGHNTTLIMNKAGLGEMQLSFIRGLLALLKLPPRVRPLCSATQSWLATALLLQESGASARRVASTPLVRSARFSALTLITPCSDAIFHFPLPVSMFFK